MTMITLLVIFHVLGSVIAYKNAGLMGVKLPRWVPAINAASLALYIAVAMWSSTLGWAIVAASILGTFATCKARRVLTTIAA